MSQLFPENIRKVGLFVLSLGEQGPTFFDIALNRLEAMNVDYEISLPEGGEYRYLAGTDQARAESFNTLLADESIDLLFAIRGGFGAVRTLPYINWELLAKRNIPVVGFSDMTGFLLPAWKMGLQNAFVGKMAEATFGNSKLSPEEVKCCAEALKNAIAGKVVSRGKITELKAEQTGSVTAPVVPCCLPVLLSLIGTPWMPDLTGKILVLEAVNNGAMQIERGLTQLEQCGILKSLAGLVFASFTNCADSGYLPEIFQDYAPLVPGPVCSNLQFGHEEPSAVIRVGGTASLSVSSDGKVTFE